MPLIVVASKGSLQRRRKRKTSHPFCVRIRSVHLAWYSYRLEQADWLELDGSQRQSSATTLLKTEKQPADPSTYSNASGRSHAI